MKGRFKSLLASQARKRGPLRFVVGALARRNRRRGDAGVAAVLLGDEGRVLLLEHVFWPKRRWALPGGWVRSGEDPADAVVRELREELGLEATVERRILEEEMSGFAFLCRAEAQTPLRLSLEILSARWFALDELPDLLPFHRRAIDAAKAIREP